MDEKILNIKHFSLFIFALISQSMVLADSGQRIISMSPAITETLYYFKMDKSLVGVSEYCKLPSGSDSKERIGSPFTPLMEKIVTLKPTMILTQDIKDTKLVTSLKALGLNYRSFNFNTIEEIQKSLNTLVKDFEGKGIEDYNTHFLELQYKLRKKQVSGNYLAIIGIKGELEKIKGFVVAADDTYLGQILSSTGLTNLSPQKKGYGEVGLETFLKKKLHYLFFFTRDKSLEKEKIKEAISKQFKGIRVEKIVVFSNDYALVPGPRVIEVMKDVDDVL